jgi:hypothetical protein
MLKEEGFAINRKRVQRLMRKMGIAALSPKTTAGAQGVPLSVAQFGDRSAEPGLGG